MVHIKTTGHEKSHFIVVLSCLSEGTKLKPVVIFKRKNLDGTKDDYLFMDQSDGEDETEYDDVPEDITEDEYDELFMLSEN